MKNGSSFPHSDQRRILAIVPLGGREAMRATGQAMSVTSRGSAVPSFIVDFAGLQLHHCAILEKDDGHLTADPTQGKMDQKSVRFADGELHREFRSALARCIG
jgi:hypothetical protein